MELENQEKGEAQLPRPIVQSGDAIVPVTIRQIINAPVEQGGIHLIVDGYIRKHFSIVGQVLSADIDNASINYIINDGTGSIEVLFCFSGEANPIQKGAYAMASGRVTGPSRQCMMAFAVQTVDDHNQIPFHMIQTIYVHLLMTKKPIQQKPVAAIPRGEQISQAIIGLMKSHNVGTKLRVDEIAKCLEKTGFPLTEIAEKLQDLSLEGMVVETSTGVFSLC